MNDDLNYNQEMLQDILLTLRTRDVIELQLRTLRHRFRLTGHYVYQDGTAEELRVPTDWVLDAAELFEKVLDTLEKRAVKNGDSIVTIYNPTNALYLTGEQQRDIVQRLGMMAVVTVNGV